MGRLQRLERQRVKLRGLRSIEARNAMSIVDVTMRDLIRETRLGDRLARLLKRNHDSDSESCKCGRCLWCREVKVLAEYEKARAGQ